MPLVIGLGGDDSWKDPLNLYGGKAPEAPKPIRQPSAPPQRSMFSDADRNDLVNTIIAEAAGEGDQGMAAVASVIRNRSAERGMSPGDVVRQRRQFSGYEAPGPEAVKAQRDPAMRSRAEAALDGVFDGSIKDTTGGADHYHADSITPSWADTMPQTAKIGRHIFYKAGKGGVPEVAYDRESPRTDIIDPFQAILNPNYQPPAANEEDDYGSVSGLRHSGKTIGDYRGLAVHHTGGHGSPEDVVRTLNERGYGAQYIMDRDGKIYSTGAENEQVSHIRNAQNGSGLSNSNTLGIEVIANDDKDLTDAQIKAGVRFINDEIAKNPDIGIDVYGHGELNDHKQATEGMSIVNAYRAERDAPLRRPAVPTPRPEEGGSPALAYADDSNDDLRPFHPNEKRPNADGSYSTEISTTWQMPDGKWVNVPSLWMGKDGPQQFKANDEEGILGAMQKYEGKHGLTFARFNSEEEAVAAAEKRSAAGGAGAGPATENAIVIDENYKPANGLGFMTSDNPLAAIAGQERQRVDAEKAQVADQFEQNRNRALTEQHNNAVGSRQQQLESGAPGRYVEIDESELPTWQEKWEADNRSGGFGGDTKRILESGSIGIGQSLSSLADTLFRKLPGGEAFLKASDDIDKWAMGKTLDQRMTESQTRANASVTERQGEADAKNWWDEEKHTFGPAWRDPRSYLRTVGESAPSTVVTMLPGGIMARGAYLRAIGAGLGERAAAATAARTATLAGAITEGTMGGADSARNVRQKIEAIPREQLAQSDAVKAMVQGGMSQDEAIKALTEDAASQAFLTAGVATGMFGGMGDRALAKIIGEGVSGGIARRIATGAAKGFVGEGLLEEAPQGAAQQVAENAAVRRADPNQSLTEGVGEAVASGVAAGGAMGAGLGGVGGAARPAASPESSEAAAVEAAPAPVTPEPAPQPRGPLARAVQHAEQQIQRRGAEAAVAAPTPAVEASAPGAPTPAAPTDGRPQQGATVRVDADGIEPFMARIDGYEGDEAVVIDSGSGEVYQVPLANITQIAKSPEELNREQPIEKGVVPINDAIPDFSNDPALEPQAPIAGETKSEPPSPKGDTQPATERLVGKPRPGQRVIVDDKDGGRFPARVDSYEEGATEAVVTNDDGEVLQVPVGSLYVDKLTPKQIEAQDLKRDPPIKRERADAGPNSRRVFDKTMVMPDDDHAALYDLAKDRFIAKKTGGAAHTDLERVGADEVQRLADRFKVSKVALTSMADDYRYRVDRAAKEARSELPQKMPPVNDTRLRQWQRDRSKEEAAAAPAAEQDAAETPNFSDWWDLTLDDLGRKKVLEQAGVKRSERGKWAGFTPAVRKKLEAFHQADTPATSPADISPVSEADITPPSKSKPTEDEFDVALRAATKKSFEKFLAAKAEMEKYNEFDAPADVWTNYSDASDAMIENFRLAGLPGDGLERGARPINGVEDIEAAFSTATPEQLDRYWLSKDNDAKVIDATVDNAAHEAATSPRNGLSEPSQAQKEAGNYKLGHVKLGGFDISVENPAGSERTGVDPNGKPWSVEMKSHYGYIKGTVGKDKDHVDVFVKPGTEAMNDGDLVFVVDQKKGNGHFDEHKAMLGFSSEREARAAYLENYSAGWNGLRSITATTLGEFKDWLKSGKTDQPYAQRNLREDRFPEIGSLKPISFGPGGRVNPKAIEPGAALYREMSSNGLEGLLLHDDIADVANFFVANKPELALGQGLNRGVHVAFRPDSLSGREHPKPGLEATGGKEFTVDMVAPRSVAVITLPAKEVKKLRARVRQILSTEFTRRDVDGGLVTFTRDGLDQSTYDEALGFAEDRTPDPIISGSANDMRDVDAPEGAPSSKWAKESVVAAGRQTGHEYLAAIDDDGSLVSYGTAGKSNFTGLNDRLLAALANPTRAIDIHHNHPQSGPLSAADIGMLAMPGLRSVAAYGHDGTQSTAQLTPDAKAQYPGTGRVEAIGELTGMLRKVQQALKPVLDRAVRRGEITPDEAGAAWSALPGLAARDAGIINLKSSVDFNPASVPGLEAELTKAVSQLKEDFANGRDKVRAARVRGPADALGRSADVAELAEAGQRVAGEFREGGLSEGSSRNDQGEEWHDVERQLGTTKATPSTIVGAVNDALSGKFVDVQPHLLATVPLNYFPELAGGRIPAIDDYLLVKRKMDAYRGVKHDEAVKVIDQWRKLISKGFVGTDKSRAAQLADLMHAATLAGVDPSVTTDEEKAKDGWQALRKQFLALPPKGQELFQTVRDAYRKQADETDQLLLDNVRKAQEIALQQAEQRYRAKLDEIADKKMSPPDRRKAEEDAASTYKAESTKGRWAANARMTRLRQQFESNRVPAPYFPLGRFGRYFTVAKDIDGKVLHFGKHETKADMDNALKALKRELPNATLGSGVMEEGGEARKAMDPRVLAEIETMLANSGVGDDIRDALYQRYLETMPDLSMRKRFIHRKGTPGYNRDAFRVFASTMFHGSHQMARLKYGLELQENVNLAVEQAQDQADNTRDMTLVNELQKRDKWVRSPTGAAFTNWLTSVAYVWYMGLSPAAALVNASQTVMLGVPLLGAKFGVGKSSKALLAASKDFAVGKGDVRRSGLSKDERAAMNAFYDSGLIDRTQSHDLAAVGETGTKYNPIRAKAMNIVSWGFHNVEVMNREITALAAYRLARDAGQGHLEAINTAHERTYAIHFDMSNSSRPRVMQSDFAKTALMFRSYQINMLYRLFRDAHQSLKGETPAMRREARMQLGGSVGMMALLAGATGVPGYGLVMVAASLIGSVFGDDDDPMEVEDQFKAGVINTLGPELGGILLNGLPGHYLGIDLTSRIGMPDLWFRSPNQDLQGREEWQYWVLNSLGASVSLGGDMFEGFRVATDEKSVARGLETMAPKAVRDLMKTWRYAWEGVKSRNGDEVLPKDEVGVADVVKQALGFTPAKIRETYDRNSALRNAERKITDDRRRVMNAFAKAVEDKDPDARREALEEIKRFNAVPAHRPVAITSDGLKASLKARARNRNKKVDGVLIQNEKLGSSLRKELPPSVYR